MHIDMFKKMGLRVVLLFGVSLFTVAACFQDEVTKTSISMAENLSKEDSLVLQRIKRQLLRPRTIPAGAQSRAPTVIVVPERGTATVPAYGTLPMSPYSVNPNRGTTVVVSQVPEYNYNGIGGTYSVVPVSPVI